MPRAATLGTDTTDYQPMAFDAKIVLLANGLTKRFQFCRMKLDQLLAFVAMKMVVLRITIIVLIDRASLETHLAKQTGLNHFAQRAIDRWPTDFLIPTLSELFNKIIRFKMLMPTENLLNQKPTLLRDALPATLEKLHKAIARRRRNFYTAKSEIT